MTPPQVGNDADPATRGDVRRVHARLDELIDRIDKRYVPRELYELQIAALLSQVESHTKWLEWAQRLVIGAVVLAMLGLIITTK